MIETSLSVRSFVLPKFFLYHAKNRREIKKSFNKRSERVGERDFLFLY